MNFLPPLIQGLYNSLLVTLGASAVALALSFVAGLALITPWRVLRVPARIYVEIFRGTSALVQIFYFFYVLPLIGIELTPMTAGIMALGMCFSAYGAEVVRSSIQAVDKGQWEASHALSFSWGMAVRRVIIPQALRRMLPPFGNLLVELLKATSLVSLIGITELAFTGSSLVRSTGENVLVYLLVMAVYFAAAYPLSLLVRHFERRMTKAW
ncbi:ectoine/hydroxyectoine ABC transporter permease subunit EhuC [Arthrobacter sp. HMWF013]|uniref:ectoine/hydroxyectoine ABC transporter permease subunit EhuC n=1 Tax=Arthrobacter sp. HMWF013 TaxID=2056849 RepID=UPI000D39D3AB|nr:ectoine/hydroxyectoine ABC transporter permease subunit EhuC [Arthrobacter sp. HMWF013]PTT68760.1 ectoine/hydroxyectoine ABC transporter permease subunit EhuC [Arthrobacter sp. HMWF013]